MAHRHRTATITTLAALLAPALFVATALPAGPAHASQDLNARLPASTLAVMHPDGSVRFWSADLAPGSWDAALPAVAGAVPWRRLGPGLELGELELSAGGVRFYAVLVAVDPTVLRMRLTNAGSGPRPSRGWSVEAAPPGAVVALNAGQFSGSAPWGWVVRRGREWRPPGRGPLVATVAADDAGRIRWLGVAGKPAGEPELDAREAFQSYPVVLAGGRVPWPIRRPGRGVDVRHRDARLALGRLRDGRLLVALTRFAGLGGRVPGLPVGPRVPEMAALMGALGCRDAVLLDGGISAQLLVRDSTGATRSWSGLRRVPLGLVFEPPNG